MSGTAGLASPGKPTAPAIVTLRGAEKLFTGTEALGNLQEAAEADREATDLDRARVMAAMGHILNELRKAEETAGAAVLTTPHHGPASRLQSLIASGEAADTRFEPMASGGNEAMFDTGDWFGWARVAWEKLKHSTPHPMLRPATAIPEPLPDRARIGLLGDWGTGLYGAPEIAKAILADPDPFAMLLHLGDVYYSGTKSEMRERFLGIWPKPPGTVHRALNSNHDMYSGGDAYFGLTLPEFGQEGSYFACQNAHWTLVGLDVAYQDHAIDDTQVAWLRDVLAQAGGRRVILFSHHQLYSHFEDQGRKLWLHPGFGEILRSKCIFAWYWGHEHRCSIFERPDPAFGILARCIGHGGMPQSRKATRKLPKAGGSTFERADWRFSAGRIVDGLDLPGVAVLDGPNPFIPGEEEKFTPHGYAVLALDGPQLIEEVRDPLGKVIYETRLGG